MIRDVLLDVNNEYSIANGSFVTGDAEYQNVDLALGMAQAAWPIDTRIGAGLLRFLKAPDTQKRAKQAAITEQLLLLGLQINNYSDTPESGVAFGFTQ